MLPLSYFFIMVISVVVMLGTSAQWTHMYYIVVTVRYIYKARGGTLDLCTLSSRHLAGLARKLTSSQHQSVAVA